MHALEKANLGLRLLLELAGLAALGYWGWVSGDGWLRFVLALGIPLLFAALWGIFRVPNDPGPATVAVPGPVRLLIEAVFFGCAVFALFDTGNDLLAGIFAALLALHYAGSWKRVRWLLGSAR